ncbi:hypothetical protein CRUP_012000, partial [Coryphaenoides rupestris]
MNFSKKPLSEYSPQNDVVLLVAQGEVADGEVGVQPSLRGGLEVSQQQRVAAHVADVRPHAPAGQHRGHGCPGDEATSFEVARLRRFTRMVQTSSQRTSLKFLPMLEPWPRKHTLMILELAPPASRGGAGGPIPPARGDSSREFERLVSEHRLFQERVAESPDMSPKMRLSDPEGFLLAALRDGAALCRLLERLRPGTLQQPARVFLEPRTDSERQSNISEFLKGCALLSVEKGSAEDGVSVRHPISSSRIKSFESLNTQSQS